MIGKLMLTLALETSTSQGSLALFDGEALLESYHFQALRGHNSKIYRPLESMLDVLGDRRLDRLVVGTGPGSYTGVRIAIAIADKPLIPAPRFNASKKVSLWSSL